MRKRTVKLHGHHCEISVHREGKHVWIAVGDYKPFSRGLTSEGLTGKVSFSLPNRRAVPD